MPEQLLDDDTVLFFISFRFYIKFLTARSIKFSTFHLTDSYIIFTLKMESISKNTIVGLKMTVKSGLERIFLKFLHVKAIFFKFILLTSFEENHKFRNKNNHLPTQSKECARILTLRVKVHPGELWVSKQRVHIVQ